MWQYNGAASWTDIVEWCQLTFDKESVRTNLWETIIFDHEQDYEIFLLKWS